MAESQKDGKTPGDGKVTVTIRLPADLVEAVDALAEDELRSRSSQIQRLLEKSIETQPVTAPARK